MATMRGVAVVSAAKSWRTLAAACMFLAFVLVIAWPAPARATTDHSLSIDQLSPRATMGVDARQAATGGMRAAREDFPPKYFWGHVSDSATGQMLPGVAVKATQPGTGLVYTTSTDAAGYYRLDVNPDPSDMFGEYNVELSKAGYQTKSSTIWLSLIWHSAGPGDPGDGHVDEALTPTSTPTPPRVIFYDGFEGNTPPWTVRGDPTWAATQYRAAAGQKSAYCAGSAFSAPGPYANNMGAWLIAGPFDLSTVTWATLQFKLYMKTQQNADFIGWYASIDGTNYSGRRDSGNSQGWVDKSLDLTAVPTLGNVCGRSQVWIAFVFRSDASTTGEGAYVDEVTVLGDASPAPGDTVGPVCTARNVTVKRGKTCQIRFRVYDALSAQVTMQVKIATKSGAVKKRWSRGYDENYDGWWYQSYRCTLRRGTYRIVVTGKDLAGNSASKVGWATLKVK